MSELILTFIATLQIKVAIFTLLLLALLYGAKRLSSRDKFVSMKIALGVLAILPLLQLAMPSYHISFDWLSDRSHAAIEVVGTVAEASKATIAPLDSSYAIANSLLTGYSLIAGLLLLRLLLGLYRTQRQIRRYQRLDSSDTLDLLERLTQQLRVQPPELRVDETGTGPYVWGVGTPIIAVPREFASVSTDVQRTVLTHELIHIQRRDTLVCIAWKILCCLYWLNPAIWWLERRLKLEMEKSCDQQALSQGASAIDYAEQLLEAVKRFNVIRREPQCAVSMARASSLHHRIKSLLAPHEQRGNMSNAKLAVFGVGLLGAAMAIGAVTTTPSTTSTSATDQVAYAAIQHRIERMASDTGDIRINKLSVAPFRIEVEGNSNNTKGISKFMRALDDLIGAPTLHYVKNSADGSADFRISLQKFDRYVPDEATR